MSVLSDEIANDPLGRGYAGMTNQEAADSLNAVDRPAPVPAKTVRKYLDLVGRWGGIARQRWDGPTAAARDAAFALHEALADYTDFDLQDPLALAAITAQLDACIAAGLIDTEHKTAILALEDNQRSRAAELGIGRVTEADVQDSRAA